jgi:uncharacterized protein
MFRIKVIRSPQKRIPSRILRWADGAFWFVLALAVVVGGKGALAGLPEIGRHLSPSEVMEAQASGDVVKPVAARLALAGFPASQNGPAVLYPVKMHELPAWMRDPAAASASKAQAPAVAIVIDDMGPNESGSRRAIALPAEVALSFLPYADATSVLAKEAARKGHDVMVHLPMQAEADADPGPMALMVSDPPEEIRRRVAWNLSRVPGYVGINNHMGSRFTESKAALAPVMADFYDRHVFFLDSVTSPRSQGVAVARAFGVASAGRDVFLDDVQTAEEVTARLAELERIAKRAGVALAIGHPHDVTLTLLARWCASQHAVRLVRIKDAIRMKTEREMGVPVAELSAAR